MSEIADLTYNVVAFSEIMSMVWKRLNDHGKNWRHVYKVCVWLTCNLSKYIIALCIISFNVMAACFFTINGSSFPVLYNIRTFLTVSSLLAFFVVLFCQIILVSNLICINIYIFVCWGSSTIGELTAVVRLVVRHLDEALYSCSVCLFLTHGWNLIRQHTNCFNICLFTRL